MTSTPFEDWWKAEEALGYKPLVWEIFKFFGKEYQVAHQRIFKRILGLIKQKGLILLETIETPRYICIRFTDNDVVNWDRWNWPLREASMNIHYWRVDSYDMIAPDRKEEERRYYESRRSESLPSRHCQR